MSPKPNPFATPPATGGSDPSTDETPPATEGTPPATEGTPPATDGTPPATDGTPPATDGTPPASGMSIVGLIISRLIGVCLAFLFFHYVFDDKCGNKYQGLGSMGRIKKEFSENGLRNGALVFLYILINLSNVYQEYSDAKTDEQKSTVIEKGGFTAFLDLLSALVIMGALLYKCRSPLWAFVPMLIMVIIISLVVLGASVSLSS